MVKNIKIKENRMYLNLRTRKNPIHSIYKVILKNSLITSFNYIILIFLHMLLLNITLFKAEFESCHEKRYM